MNLFFTIHYHNHLKPAERFGVNCFDAEATVEGFQVFVNHRFFPWVRNVQHLLCIEGIHLQLSVSGTVLQLMQAFNPGALQALQELAVSRQVIFAEITFYHSICSLFLKEEREEQIQLHRSKINEIFSKQTIPVKAASENSYLPSGVLSLARKLCSLEAAVKETQDEKLLQHWRLLQDKTYYAIAQEALLGKQLTNLEMLLAKRKHSMVRIRYPQHSYLL